MQPIFTFDPSKKYHKESSDKFQFTDNNYTVANVGKEEGGRIFGKFVFKAGKKYFFELKMTKKSTELGSNIGLVRKDYDLTKNIYDHDKFAFMFCIGDGEIMLHDKSWVEYLGSTNVGDIIGVFFDL